MKTAKPKISRILVMEIIKYKIATGTQFKHVQEALSYSNDAKSKNFAHYILEVRSSYLN